MPSQNHKPVSVHVETYKDLVELQTIIGEDIAKTSKIDNDDIQLSIDAVISVLITKSGYRDILRKRKEN